MCDLWRDMCNVCMYIYILYASTYVVGMSVPTTKTQDTSQRIRQKDC